MVHVVEADMHPIEGNHDSVKIRELGKLKKDGKRKYRVRMMRAY